MIFNLIIIILTLLIDVAVALAKITSIFALVTLVATIAKTNRSDCVEQGQDNKGQGQDNKQPVTPPPSPSVEAKREQQRRHVAKEFVDTEKDYVDALNTVDNELIRPLLEALNKGQEILPAQEQEKIFQNLPKLHQLHCRLLGKINSNMESGECPSKCLADAFLSEDYLEGVTLYIEYFIGHPEALKTFNRAMKKVPAFKELCNTLQNHPDARNQGLLSFLIKPVQRICKYTLFFRELVKYSPGHQNLPRLELALAKANDMCARVNEAVGAAKKREKMKEIIAKVQGKKVRKSLISDNRRLLHVTDVAKTDIRISGKRVTCMEKPMTVCVFNDILLVLQKKRTVLGQRYVVRGEVNIDSCAIMNGNSRVAVNAGKQQFIFELAEEQKVALQKAVNEAKLRGKSLETV